MTETTKTTTNQDRGAQVALALLILFAIGLWIHLETDEWDCMRQGERVVYGPPGSACGPDKP